MNENKWTTNSNFCSRCGKQTALLSNGLCSRCDSALYDKKKEV